MAKFERPVFSYSLKAEEEVNNYFGKEELQEAEDLARRQLSLKRFLHCQGVGDMLFILNKKLGEQTCMLLGYFHDMTKSWTREMQIDCINNSSAELYEGEENLEEVFHAISGSIVFKTMYPQAPLLFSLAIRHHSILSYDIRADLIYDLFVADKIEEGRSYIDNAYRNKIISIGTAEERAFEVLKMEGEELRKNQKDYLPCTLKLLAELEQKYAR